MEFAETEGSSRETEAQGTAGPPRDPGSAPEEPRDRPGQVLPSSREDYKTRPQGPPNGAMMPNIMMHPMMPPTTATHVLSQVVVVTDVAPQMPQRDGRMVGSGGWLDEASFARIASDQRLYAAGKIGPEAIPTMCQVGIKTVVQLLLPAEIADPQIEMEMQMNAKCSKVEYAKYRQTNQELDEEELDRLLGFMDKCERPLLVFCSDGCRSTAICAAYNDTRKRTTAAALVSSPSLRDRESAMSQTTVVPFLTSPVEPDSPQNTLKEFMHAYTDRKVAQVAQRRKARLACDGVYVGGQPTESELEELKRNFGIKTVVCVRSLAEAGQCGLGVLSREEGLVKAMGMVFANIEVPKAYLTQNSEKALVAKVKEMESLELPVFVHSANGERAEKIGSIWNKRRDGHYMSLDPVAAESYAKVAGKVLLVSALMGLAFGAAMESGKVTLPVVIRQQFLFQRFIMLKMFLSASGASAFFCALMAVFFPEAMMLSRDTFMGCGCGKGLIAIGSGTFILGMGMAIGGACPGMVLVQVGSGVENSGFTLLGGIVAAMVYGVLQPWIQPHLGVGSIRQVRAEDFKILSKYPFKALAMGLALMLGVVVVLFEVFFPWTSEIPGGLTPWDQSWPPSLSGLLIGFLQVPCVLFLGDTLGSSSAYMTLNAQLLLIPGLQQQLPHLEGFRKGVGNLWQLIYIGCAILGALMSSKITGTFGVAKGVPLPDSLIGGFLMIFGSRIASGCTSGHGLSGMALLSVQSIFAVPCMFAGGIVTAFIYYSASPDYVNGLLQA